MAEVELALSKEIVMGKLRYQYFHYEHGLTPKYLGDGILEFPDGTVLIFDVSLGATTQTIPTKKDKGMVEIDDRLVAKTLRKYLEKNFSEGLSVKEVVNLCAKFLEEKTIGRLVVEMGLSATACRKENDFLTFVSFGSNLVLGPNEKALIKPGKVYDPYLSLHTAEQRKETSKMTEKLEIPTKRVPLGASFVMATDGFEPTKALNLSDFARRGYPLEELIKNPNCFVGEALLVRIK